MGRSLEEMISAETPEVQAKIEARYLELLEEAGSLAEVRKLADNSQVELAEKLHIKQPTISKMERQADMYLSSLREYIEGVGGKLRLVVTLPNVKEPLVLRGIGELKGRKLAAANVKKTVHKQAAKRVAHAPVRHAAKAKARTKPTAV